MVLTRDSDRGMRTEIKSYSHTHTHTEMDSPSHCASFFAPTMSVRMKMKIFATQIGFALMKVISLGKRSRLIHEMRIDSDSVLLLVPSPSLSYLPAPQTPRLQIPTDISQDTQIVFDIQT